MTSTVTLESIIQAQDQRSVDLQASLEQEQYRDRHDYIALKNEVSPYMPDLKLHKILDETTVESGEWLQSDRNFKKWDDPKSKGSRFLWIHGIPGAGSSASEFQFLRSLQSYLINNLTRQDFFDSQPDPKVPKRRTPGLVRVSKP